MKIDISEIIETLEDLEHSLKTAAMDSLTNAYAAYGKSNHDAVNYELGKRNAYHTARMFLKDERKRLERLLDTYINNLQGERNERH